MNKIIIFPFIAIMIGNGCHEHTSENHDHESESLSFTLYSDKSELFVEFQPLITGHTTQFAAHLTLLGDHFLPLERGKVSVSLIVGDTKTENSTDSASSPGIFRLSLKPQTSGVGQLVFDVQTPEFKDRFIIENVNIYENDHQVPAPESSADAGQISFLKEQAWYIEFANTPVMKQSISKVIKTSGQILSAQGDEVIITANAEGSVLFSGDAILPGSKLNAGDRLFTITGGNVTSGTLDARYNEAKAEYNKAKADYERASELLKDKIVSEKEYLKTKLAYENAQTRFNTISKNHTSAGQVIRSPMTGFVKNILVTEGQYVEAGTALALISKNKKLLLKAMISQRYFDQIPGISDAHFKMAGHEELYGVKDLKGKVISYGKSISDETPFIPLVFEMDNPGGLIPGAVVEIYLKSGVIPDVLTIPVTALLEEQGNFYVFVQTSGESFVKRRVTTGVNDGINVQILSGLKEGERVVSKGAYQVKLAASSGELPAHGHEH